MDKPRIVNLNELPEPMDGSTTRNSPRATS